MNSLTPEVSILIPAYNEERLIAGVLDSVHRSFAALPQRTFEIIVCDNNSTDRTAAIAAENGALVVPEPHNQIARARNTAAKSARGRWFIFLDADTFLNPGVLQETIAALESRSVCGGGSVMRFDGESLPLFAILLWRTWTAVSVLFALAAGSYLFCLREAWVETGGFDETVYAGEELFFSGIIKAWGKERGLKFKVLNGSPVLTSARKMEWYGQWELFYWVLRMSMPGAIRSREKCNLWYVRPGKS